MADVNFLAVAVTAVAAMLVSTTWYVVLAKPYTASLQQFTSQGTDHEARPPTWKVLVELVRNLVLATGIALLAGGLDLVDALEGLLLGLGLWVVFPVVLLAGSVIWDGAPSRLAAIHAGDWGVKLALIATVLVIWV